VQKGVPSDLTRQLHTPPQRLVPSAQKLPGQGPGVVVVVGAAVVVVHWPQKPPTGSQVLPGGQHAWQAWPFNGWVATQVV
jgi:hypothetical protein